MKLFMDEISGRVNAYMKSWGGEHSPVNEYAAIYVMKKIVVSMLDWGST